MGFDIEVSEEEQRPLRTDPKSGIELKDELSGELTVNTKLNTNTGDNVQSVPVGGALSKPAAYWKNLSLAMVLDEILFPDILPTYELPVLTLSSPNNLLREVGETINHTFEIRGYKNDAGGFTGMQLDRNFDGIWSGAFTTTPIADVPDQFDYANPNNPNFMYSKNYNESYVLPKGNTFWRAYATYQNGLVKLDNKGIVDARPLEILNINAGQLGSTFTSNVVTVTAIYPVFWGVSTSLLTAADIEILIENGSTNKLFIEEAEDISIEFEAAGQYLWFAYWQGLATKNKWFVNSFNTGNIGAGSNLFGAPTVRDINSPQGLWSNVDFKIHVSNYPTTTYGVMELRNS